MKLIELANLGIDLYMLKYVGSSCIINMVLIEDNTEDSTHYGVIHHTEKFKEGSKWLRLKAIGLLSLMFQM